MSSVNWIRTIIVGGIFALYWWGGNEPIRGFLLGATLMVIVIRMEELNDR